jgi:hypothetical protein
MNKLYLDKVKVTEVPLDIIYNICKFLNIVDICNFRRINKIIFYNITRVQGDLLSYQLRLQSDFINCNYFYDWLNTYLRHHVYQYRQMFSNVSSHNTTNLLFDIIFTYYTNNNFCNIKTFPNKLLLLTFYNFQNLEYYTQSDYNYFNYRFNFLEHNNIANINDLKIHYYNSVLYKFHYQDCIQMTFNQMCTISDYVTSIPIIQKILGYKELNLSNTVLNLCCYDCNENCLIEICNLKRHFWKDNLISYNYIQFKTMLKKNNLYYYNFICNREDIAINSMIYIKNPVTNRRVRVNKTIYNNLIYNLDEYKLQKITNYISNQKNYFRNKFFN